MMLIQSSLQGIKPASLSKVSDLQVREFIEKCLLPASQRLSAKQLLKEPFLHLENPAKPIRDPLQVHKQRPKSKSLPEADPLSMEIDADYKQVSIITCTGSNESLHSPVLECQRSHNNNEFRLKGQKNDDNTISLTLRIADSIGTSTCI